MGPHECLLNQREKATCPPQRTLAPGHSFATSERVFQGPWRDEISPDNSGPRHLPSIDMRSPSCGLVLLALTAPLAAQHPGVFYPEPSASAYSVTRDIRYATVDTTTLRMDVYRPARATTSSPALVFFTLNTQRANPGYASWARIAAAQGLVAVLADLRVTEGKDDFRTLLTHLTERARDYGIDTSAVAVYGASNNGFNAMPVVQDPRETRVKASIIYYSGGDVTQFRRDLPVLYIRSGLDRPFVNASIDSTIARALAQNAPMTIINFPAGHHGFETSNDDAITRDLIDQTIAFIKRVTAPAYRAALLAGVDDATAAMYVSSGEFTSATEVFARLVARRPDDAPLRLSYGTALLGAQHFAAACAEFEKLKGKGLGARDLGLPAAAACLQNGDPEGAMAWLESIPKPYLPVRVKDDPTFAPLKERADFKALFER